MGALRTKVLTGVLLGFLVAVPTTLRAGGETAGVTVKATELKEKPFSDAATLSRLAPKTELEIVGRQGGWNRVRVKGKEGWVRMMDVRTVLPSGQTSLGKEMRGAEAVATGRAGSGNIVATSGIRGLSEEELRSAVANPEEFRKLDGFGELESSAREYARQNHLAAQQIPYLPAPSRSTGAEEEP